MESALNLLKQEINKTHGAVQDLAKWKLVVTAALGAAAFGLFEKDPKYWLLLFAPFVCAYIDLYAYQLELRVLVIARFLQRHRDGEDDFLQQYEKECETLRGPGKHVFSLDSWAGIGCSLAVCVSGPVLYFLQCPSTRQCYLGISLPWAKRIWLSGVVLIGLLYLSRRLIELQIPRTKS